MDAYVDCVMEEAHGPSAYLPPERCVNQLVRIIELYVSLPRNCSERRELAGEVQEVREILAHIVSNEDVLREEMESDVRRF